MRERFDQFTSQLKEQLLKRDNSLVLEGEQTLEIYQPHSIIATADSTRLQTQKQITRFIEKYDKPIIFWFESGAKNNSRAKSFKQWLSGDSRTSLDINSIKRFYESENTDISLYEAELYTFFDSQRNKYGSIESPIIGKLEEMPPIQQVGRTIRGALETQLTPNELLGRYTNLISYATVRDLRLGAQITNHTLQNPEFRPIIIRGVGHLGLAPALRTLARMQGMDQNRYVTIHKTRSFGVGPDVAVTSQVTWQEHFWEDVIQTSEVGLKEFLNDNIMSRMQPKIQRLLKDSSWSDTLKKAIGDHHSTSTNLREVTLKQNKPLDLL